MILKVVLLGLISAAVCEPLGRCPEPDTETNNTFLSDSDDPTKFYECEDGLPTQRNCPDHLEFILHLESCVFVVRENDGTTTTETTTTENSEANLKCPGERDEFLPHEFDCTKFYKCERGELTLYSCSAGLHFNPVLKICDQPDRAGCNAEVTNATNSPSPSSETTVTESTPPSTLPTSSSTTESDSNGPNRKCPEINGKYVDFVPHESDCTKFYKCDWGELKLFNCSAGLHFNPVLNVCDWPEQAGCKASSPNTTDPEQTPPQTPPTPPSTTESDDNRPNRECPEVNGEYVNFVPHETDCTKFYKCDWGELKLFNCSAGLHFNPVLNVCDWPERAGCKAPSTEAPNQPSPSPDTTVTEPRPPQTPPSSSSTTESDDNRPNRECPKVNGEYVDFVPHESDCTKFYKCDWGELKLFNCSVGLHFNPVLNVCDWPERAGCKASSPNTTDPEQTPPQTPPTPPSTTESDDNRPNRECPEINGKYVDFVPHESDCTKFYKCDWGELKLLNCSAGLHFNPVLNVCDWPEHAGCKTSSPNTTDPEQTPPQTPPTPSSTTESDDNRPNRKCPEVNGKYVDFVPHESDCTKFYKCDWGELKLFNCSAGLHFNPVLNVCDWPERAGCKAPSTVAPNQPSSSPDTTVTEPRPPQTPPSSSSTTESHDNRPNRECPEINGKYVDFVPHESDCTKFYKCDWGELKLFNCSAGLHFNPVLNVCDWPEQAGCKASSPNTTDPEQTPPQTPPTPPSTTESDDNRPNRECPEINGKYVDFVPHESDCTKFYKCDWGELKLFNCSAGLHFNPVLNVCDWPEQAGCKAASTEAPNQPSPSPDTTVTEPRPPQTPPSSSSTTESDGNEPNRKCPEVNGKYVDFVPHETDCTKFYKCDWGELKLFNCSAGLHFNSVLNVCDWPEHAGCKTSSPNTTDPEQTPPQTPPTPPSTTEGDDNRPNRECPKVNGEYVDFVPHESDCTKFYKCDWGELKLFNCSAGLHFNPVLNVCDWPEQAGCKAASTEAPNQPSPSPDTTVTEPRPPQTPPSSSSTTESDGNEPNRKCPEVNGKYVDFVPHETDCTKFYKCDWGELKLFNCSAGLHFNSVLNVCDWPEHAGCKTSSPNTTDPEQTPPQTPPTPPSTTEGDDNRPNRECPKVNGEYVDFVPHESDCTKFYKCDWGELKLFNCSAGLHFNPVLNVCNWPERAGCKAPSTEAPNQPSPSPDTTVTEPRPPQTPPSSSSTTESDGNGPNRECPKVNGEYVDFVPHESDCTKFYKCDRGELKLYNCTAGLHFNPALNVCDWPEQAGCIPSTEVITSSPNPSSPSPDATVTESTSTQTPPIPPSTTEDHGNESSRRCPVVNGSHVYFLPHESNCSKFYKCDWGRLILFNCPGGLHFNPALDVCDWPQNARCESP